MALRLPGDCGMRSGWQDLDRKNLLNICGNINLAKSRLDRTGLSSSRLSVESEIRFLRHSLAFGEITKIACSSLLLRKSTKTVLR